MRIRRGGLYIANLNPRQGTEPGKQRPVLVVQTDMINGSHPSTIVCLLTTQVRHDVALMRAHLKKGEGGLREDSDVLIDQVRAVDNARLKREIGRLSPARLRDVEERLRMVMEL